MFIVDKQDQIAHNNLKLANRIFDIMEGPGLISNILKNQDTDHGCHPGTLNFKMRVKEATRIHKQNISMAARLDNVKPIYGRDVDKIKGPNGSPTKSETGRVVVPGLKFPKSMFNGNDINTARSEGNGKKVNIKHLKTKSARDGNEKKDTTGANGGKKNNVLLEYSKIQNGRVLDIAVIKEPYQDRYAIFGIDIDNGQRYELRLTSDDVSSILDGDILVTSLDNVEVWLALLNKVNLKEVKAFSKLSQQPNNQGNGPVSMAFDSQDAVIGTSEESALEPEAPTGGRPTTRPGGRGSRSQARNGSTEKVTSVDQYEEEIPDVSNIPEVDTIPIIPMEMSIPVESESIHDVIPDDTNPTSIQSVDEQIASLSVDEKTPDAQV